MKCPPTPPPRPRWLSSQEAGRAISHISHPMGDMPELGTAHPLRAWLSKESRGPPCIHSWVSEDLRAPRAQLQVGQGGSAPPGSPVCGVRGRAGPLRLPTSPVTKLGLGPL